MSWEKLLRASGWAGMVAMAVVAVTIGDLEAAAVAVGFGVSMVLLRFRTGLLGRLGIGLVSAITFFFMVTAGVTNVRADSPSEAVLLSGGLAAIALGALLSASATLVRRGSAGQPSILPWLAIALSVILFFGLWGWSGATSGADASGSDVTLVAENVAFSESALSAPAGEVTVALANKDLFWHTFTIEELGVDLLVPVGANRSVTFQAEPGTYRFFCRIPGHLDAGMAGSLVVSA